MLRAKFLWSLEFYSWGKDIHTHTTACVCVCIYAHHRTKSSQWTIFGDLLPLPPTWVLYFELKLPVWQQKPLTQ